MPKIRVTWLGMVAIFLILLHQQIARSFSLAIGGSVLLFIGLVILPVLLTALWRQGLLPPERVAVHETPPDEPPQP
jgi:hypothetical protein